MNNSIQINDKFVQYIDAAIDSLRHNELGKAYDSIVEAIHMNPDAPQPHNLLGIFYEFTRDSDKARRHYRAAYSLDPTYKPPCINLERIGNLFDNSRPHSICYGDEPEEVSTIKREKSISFLRKTGHTKS